ncbi:MAG: hypothetical protein K2P75_09530 [Sphingobacteriaceae bacterium]|nr:hypothetical protein [Sphingobacteriaceae bacterium]
MNTSILEITAESYCIKLSKSSNSLALVRKLINFLEAENSSKIFENQDTDIISRYHDNYEGDFDRLDDK